MEVISVTRHPSHFTDYVIRAKFALYGEREFRGSSTVYYDTETGARCGTGVEIQLGEAVQKHIYDTETAKSDNAKPYEYVRRFYGVDPKVGQMIKHHVTGKTGKIVEPSYNVHYLSVDFDDGRGSVHVHPTECDILKPPKPQKPERKGELMHSDWREIPCIDIWFKISRCPWQIKTSTALLDKDSSVRMGDKWGWSNSKIGGMGRFGGGWQWKLGAMGGDASVVISLIWGDIHIQKGVPYSVQKQREKLAKESSDEVV